MKRKYEIVYIFDSALEEPEVDERLGRFHDLLKSPDNPEPITGIAHWGKRTLAYPIAGKEIGYYVVAQFEADTQLLGEFERIIKLNDTVLRYLVVINEGLPMPAAHDSGSSDSGAGDDEDEGDDDDGGEDESKDREQEPLDNVESPGEEADPEPQTTQESEGSEQSEEPSEPTKEGGE